MQISGIGDLRRALRAEVSQARQEVITAQKRVTRTLVEELMANTPVWSGESVRNYAVGIGSVPAEGSKPAIGTGRPGKTSQMRLGEEPRRPANEAAARADMEAVLAALTRMRPVFVTNLIDENKWNLVDSGAAPTPAAARYPGAIAMRAEQTTRELHAELLE